MSCARLPVHVCPDNGETNRSYTGKVGGGGLVQVTLATQVNPRLHFFSNMSRTV